MLGKPGNWLIITDMLSLRQNQKNTGYFCSFSHSNDVYPPSDTQIKK